MKIPRSRHARPPETGAPDWRPPRPRRNQGVAIIVALVVLAVMAALLAANAKILANLKAHILFLENKQQQKFFVDPPAPPPHP